MENKGQPKANLLIGRIRTLRLPPYVQGFPPVLQTCRRHNQEGGPPGPPRRPTGTGLTATLFEASCNNSTTPGRVVLGLSILCPIAQTSLTDTLSNQIHMVIVATKALFVQGGVVTSGPRHRHHRRARQQRARRGGRAAPHQSRSAGDARIGEGRPDWPVLPEGLRQ